MDTLKVIEKHNNYKTRYFKFITDFVNFFNLDTTRKIIFYK